MDGPDNFRRVCRSVFENAIDMAHIHYLHNDTFGNQGQPQIRHMTCSTEPYGVTAQFGLHNKPVNAMWEFSKVSHLPVRSPPALPVQLREHAVSRCR